MATSGPRSPTAATNASSWVNETNILSSNNASATFVYTSGVDLSPDMFDAEIHLIKANGALSAGNRGFGTTLETTDTIRTYGAADDLWGETWTYADINDDDFGVAVSYAFPPERWVGEEPGYGDYTGYLKASDFGFTLPDTAQIIGIQVSVEAKGVKSHPGDYLSTISVDHITLTVHYLNVIEPRLPADIINTLKVGFAEFWSTILTTWAEETRTWNETTSLFDAESKPGAAVSNTNKPS